MDLELYWVIGFSTIVEVNKLEKKKLKQRRVYFQSPLCEKECYMGREVGVE